MSQTREQRQDTRGWGLGATRAGERVQLLAPRPAVPLRFDGLFREKPGSYLVLKPDLTIEDVSDEYMRATLIWRDEVRDCGLFEVFPDNPHDPAADGVRNLRASLLEVLKHGRPHRMPIQRYDVRDRAIGNGAWLERFWAPVNMPVFGGGSREITHVIHQVVDVTRAVLLERWRGEPFRVHDEQRTPLDHPRELRRYLSAGQRAPVRGIFTAFHLRGCELTSSQVFMQAGQTLPRCTSCRAAVFYRLLTQ